MKIIIVGAGLVGSSLAQQLMMQKHDLAVIEKDPGLCGEIEEKFDLLVVNGSGSDPDAMMAAGGDSAEILLAVTPDDEINILACAIGKHYGIPKRIARIRNQAFVDVKKFDLAGIGITDMIDPETTLVESILEFISTPGAIEAVSFENGRICLREYRITAEMPVVGKTLREIRESNIDAKILVMTVVRKDKAIIPTGGLVVEEGDEILVVFPEASRGAFMEMLNLPIRNKQKIVISGSNRTCFKLAQKLQGLVDQVIWVSPDYEYGHWGAGQLDKVQVLHGDCTDEGLLRDIHIDNAGFFIASSTNTEHNILSSLLAKSRGVRETIVISDQPAQNDFLFRSIGIDHVINPRITTAASIMEIIHRGRRLDEIKLKGMDLEAVRILANPGSRICHQPLHKSWKPLSEKAIVGAIIRGQDLVIPAGNTVIEPGDQALVITRDRSLDTVLKLFKGRQ